MAKANWVEKTVRMNKRGIIKYQLIFHCFMNDLHHSDAELDCLALLGLYGECDMAEFCNLVVDENIFKVSQTVRNFLIKAEKAGLIDKNGKSRKKIKLSDALNIQTQGNIVLNYKLFYVEA